MQVGRRSVLALAVGGLALATGCGGAAASAAGGPAPAGVRRPARGPLPPYVRGEAAAEAYRFAAARPDLLRFVPCYCGCGAGDGHASNLDCFVAAFAADGWPTYASHGAGCGTCIAIALETKRLDGQGVPLAEIRRTIDATFAGARPGTPTPPPPA
jgi:hypothetical protein